MKESHGVITLDAAEYAPKATAALRSAFGETGRKAVYAGPLIPRTEEDTSSDPRSKKVQEFLDEHLASHGERSVVYVSIRFRRTYCHKVSTYLRRASRYPLDRCSGLRISRSYGRC